MPQALERVLVAELELVVEQLELALGQGVVGVEAVDLVQLGRLAQVDLEDLVVQVVQVVKQEVLVDR